MGKDKNKSLNETQPDDDMEEENGCESYDDQMKYVSKIAHPMASEKLSKKVSGNLLNSFCSTMK